MSSGHSVLSAAARLAHGHAELEREVSGYRRSADFRGSIRQPSRAAQHREPWKPTSRTLTSPSDNDPLKRGMAALQAEKIELSEENKQLRRRNSELEQELKLIKASTSWMSNRKRKAISSGGGSSRPDQRTSLKDPAKDKPNSSPPHVILTAAVEAARAEASAATASDDGTTVATDPTADAEGAWTILSWLQSLQTSHILEQAVLGPVGANIGWRIELCFVRALARAGSRDAFVELLGGNCDGQRLITALADELWRGAQQLLPDTPSACVTSPVELHSRFMQDPEAFTLDFGGLSEFFGGLDGLIGSPKPNLGQAVRHEHCESQDSVVEFQAANYKTTTTPRIEYFFVAEPRLSLDTLGIDAWPVEACLDPSLRRRALDLSSFQGKLQEANVKLTNLGCAPVSTDELISARLYTGPMYQKVIPSSLA